MFTRRHILTGSAGLIGAAAIPFTAAAKPSYDENASPLFPACNYILMMNRTVWHEETARIAVKIVRADKVDAIPVRSFVQAEDHFFSTVPRDGGQQPGIHKLVVFKAKVAYFSKRGMGNTVFAKANILRSLGLIRTAETIGRWRVYQDPRMPKDIRDAIVFYGTDEPIALGSDMIMAYVNRQSPIDRPGVIVERDDGTYGLVVQENPGYAIRFRAPRNLKAVPFAA